MSRRVRIIDLRGREAPRIVDLSLLDSDDVNHILDMWAYGLAAFIGEFEYQEVPDPEMAA